MGAVVVVLFVSMEDAVGYGSMGRVLVGSWKEAS